MRTSNRVFINLGFAIRFTFVALQFMLHFQNQTNFYKGKVRDVYTIDNKYVVMHASDRISAFDVILPEEIPHKGAVLTQVAAHFLNATKDIVPNWLLGTPADNMSVGYLAKPFAVEMVIRACLSGHAWRTYRQGGRLLCGVDLPEGMRENQHFENPIITPSTKAHEGHDEDISKEEIIARGIVSADQYNELERITHALFAKGQQMAADRGLVLVDTKYEFGLVGDEIYLIDEIHTPDSSRYFYRDSYDALLQENKLQRQLSKEFVREWLISNGFQGKTGQEVPPMSQEWVKEISARYIELHNEITGKSFLASDLLLEQAFQLTQKALLQLP
jgi:phosphoribosylaminoimidazole-succinocarboxamide synthase